MLTLQRFLLVCTLLVVALAAPAPISPSRSGIWLLTNAQKLSLTARSRDALHNASLRRNIFKSLRKTDPPTSAAAVPSRHSLDAFLQAHNTLRRAHAFKPKEQKMSRPNVAALAGWFTDHQSIQSKIASQTKFPALNMASIPHSNLQNTRTLKTKMGRQSGRKAAPLGTSKDLAGLFRTSLPIANRMGLTGDTCTSTSECAEGRICVDIANQDTCSSGERCLCVPTDGLESCTSSNDCSTAGEVCVQGNESTLCFSEETANAEDMPIETSTTGGTGSGGGGEEMPTAGDGDSESEGSITNPDGLNVPSGGNDDDDDLCIDARALGHLSRNGLVFEKHAVSRVLCDENDSCATRGDMVVFRGHAMRMSTYCESVGCKEAVMEVNSPRFNRGMRIKSNTKGLEYTAFAAPYETQAEESLIRMAVRFGL
ncbi:unnamed protein product [Chondrus crispus]|uniref:SCP domain-containing protein n=1 Tax=Chondrus crispus TaxID=2769 RepID=R7QQZ1_CHOCR|nr:unnamed protein product [Chondrus crispus]CDF40907.1 unnamed protein product [Chondrus crispus]|eukprot:XP_005711201.1 unnamed protein product [Chondrus crispus]